MSETPQEKVARLQHAVDEAQIAELKRQLAEAQRVAGIVAPPMEFVRDPAPRFSPNGADVGPSSWLQRSGGYPTGSDTRLAATPRHVPWTLRLVVLPWSWWTLFALFMISAAPIVIWIAAPAALAVAAVVTFVVVIGLRLQRDWLRLSLLKRGEVATLVGSEVVPQGTDYSGPTYQNVRLAQAHGWRVERHWYSGPSTKTRVTYDVHGARGTLTLAGLPYDNGVILADPVHPDRALCISSYAYDLNRDEMGGWVDSLPPRVVLGSLAMTIVLIAWTMAMILLGTGS